MRSKLILPCIFVAALLVLTGCYGNPFTPEESRLDKNWGVAYEAAKHNQILNPNAQKNQTPVTGLDGEAADRNMDAYRKSFDKDESEPTVNFNTPIMTGK
jgi:hypothetical protein